jgi:histidinol-phosphate aminotransferase
LHTRPTLADLPPSIHGARDYGELARLGLEPEAVSDFSANSNPYGPHPAVLEAVRAAVAGPTLQRYPDRACLALRQAIAAAEGVSPDSILPTNGASELIQLVALAFVAPGSRQLILAPTFGEYGRAIHLVGGLARECRPAGADLRFEIEALVETIRAWQPAGVWLCTPNNPTGQQLAADDLARLRAADPDQRMLWVIDESYRYFGADSRRQAAVSGQPLSQNLIVIRSLTKEHGLAGLRLGYALAQPARCEALRAVQPPWSVNSLAQAAGVAALQPRVIAWRERSLAQLHGHAARLWSALAALGYHVLPSDTPYTLVEVGQAAAFRRALLEQGCLVRDCASFGLPDHIRIAAQRPEENERLIATMKKMRDYHNELLK